MEKQLRDFEMDDIIEYIYSESYGLSNSQLETLKAIAGIDEEAIVEAIDEAVYEAINQGFHGEIEKRNTLLDALKLELVFKNIDKFSYTELKELLDKC